MDDAEFHSSGTPIGTLLVMKPWRSSMRTIATTTTRLFTPAPNGMIHVRCLRTRCQVGTVALSKGEAKDFPIDSELELTIE